MRGHSEEEERDDAAPHFLEELIVIGDSGDKQIYVIVIAGRRDEEMLKGRSVAIVVWHWLTPRRQYQLPTWQALLAISGQPWLNAPKRYPGCGKTAE